MPNKNFEDLEVWKEGTCLAVDICTMWEGMDARGYFGLADQMQRASISIPSNIAEGNERKSVADFLRFLYIAKASAAELRTQLYILARLRISKNTDTDDLIERTRILSRKLQRLISVICTKRNA